MLVFTADARATRWPAGVEVLALPDAAGRVDLDAMLTALAARGINELHVEAGAKLNGALLAGGLVDELLLYVAPCLFGDPARGMFELPSPLAQLADRVPLSIRSIEPVGEDWRIVARIAPGEV